MNDFEKMFWDIVRQNRGITYKLAYEKTRILFYEKFGYYQYSSYDSFKVVKNRRLRNKRKHI